MDLFTYLMAKKGHNTHRDLFSYLLGKNAGGSGTYTTFSGTSLNISNTLQAKIKNIALEGNTSQDGTPTPDTPIPIKVVTGEQNVEISGKNLFNVDNDSKSWGGTKWEFTNGILTINGEGSSNTLVSSKLMNANIPANTTITISMNYISGTLTGGSIQLGFRFVYDDETTYDLYTSNQTDIFKPDNYLTKKTISRTLTLSKNVVGIYLHPYISYCTCANFTGTIQIEEGSTATEYEPYQSQTYPLSLGNIELAKIGDYKDYIFKNVAGSPYYNADLDLNGWYLKKNIGKVVFNGTESWELYTDNVFSNEKITNIRNCLSDYYIFNSTERIGQLLDGQFGIANSTNNNRICFKNENCSTVTDFKTWLSTHNTEVYYPLELPTYIHISQADYPILRSQLENLYNNAKSYDGQTNITQKNDDLPFNISVDVKVLDTNLNMNNSLNTSLLSSNIQEETNIDDIQEEPNLDEIEDIEQNDEPIENEEIEEKVS